VRGLLGELVQIVVPLTPSGIGTLVTELRSIIDDHRTPLVRGTRLDLLPQAETSADLLFHIISRRDGRGATIIPSNRVQKKRPEIFLM
jgi:hypothetical protein